MKLCLSPETEPRQNNNQLGKQKEEPLQGFAGTSEAMFKYAFMTCTLHVFHMFDEMTVMVRLG